MRPCDYNDGYDDDGYDNDGYDNDTEPIPEFDPSTCSWTAPMPVTFEKVVGKLLEHIERRAKLTPLCESPIEVELGAALIVEARTDFKVVPQFKLPQHRYRYDFGITAADGDKPLMLVECDGAEFHCTAAQLANDKAKDEAAIAAGTRVIRVRGKEIYRNPQAWAAFIIGECLR